jgi:hypothetical protein
MAGGQGNGTAYLLDGADNTDAMSNVNMPFPFPDALQEFSIETSAVSSQFGTHPGATVNVVTKSGSNAISRRPVSNTSATAIWTRATSSRKRCTTL